MAAPRPYTLVAELTYRCPLRCPYCSNPINLQLMQTELSTEQWQRVFSEAAELGVVQLHLSGGEPVVRKDLACSHSPCPPVRPVYESDYWRHLAYGRSPARIS